VKKLGDFSLPAGTAIPAPLFLVTDIIVDSVTAKRTFYWLNFDSKPDSLRESPVTTLRMERSGRTVTVLNTGKVPAIAVNFVVPSISDKFLCDDNYFWLDPGESRKIQVNLTQGLEGVAAWNGGR
jgi:beta-mannosidase